ncbi:GntR family transcriptional regulator [Kitasatospora sp. NPDC048298]|uniref:GntR family transcriptional regulator n=1 Tax=Kitasatospora sp. NPDC048298 TaxID=3364049 RepID=UPI00371C9681
MPEIERPAPAYQQLVAHLRERIESGALAPGDPLSSAAELAREWGVSRPTAQRAINTLAGEDLVETSPGQVARVKGRPRPLHRTGMDRAISVRRTGRIYGDTGEYARIVVAELTTAEPEVAEALGLEVGAPVIRRLRVTYSRDDKPLSTSTSWFDGALAERAPLLLVPERIPQGTWAYLEEITGQRAIVGRDAIDVRLATDADALALGLTVPAAVKESSTLLRTGDQTVVEFGVSVSGPGRVSVYDYEL